MRKKDFSTFYFSVTSILTQPNEKVLLFFYRFNIIIPAQSVSNLKTDPWARDIINRKSRNGTFETDGCRKHSGKEKPWSFNFCRWFLSFWGLYGTGLYFVFFIQKIQKRFFLILSGKKVIQKESVKINLNFVNGWGNKTFSITYLLQTLGRRVLGLFRAYHRISEWESYLPLSKKRKE